MTGKLEPTVLIDLDDPKAISSYGASAVENGVHSALLKQLEQSPIRDLAQTMSTILEATRLGPDEGSRKRGLGIVRFFSALVGAEIEMEVSRDLSRQGLSQAVTRANGQADAIREFISTAAQYRADLAASVGKLSGYIDAGDAYLQANPTAGTDNAAAVPGLSARDRFTRKLANLRALHTAHLLSVEQLNLAVAQATDMLDRHEELVDVLLPIYRQHQMAVANKQFLAPHAVALAVQTHEHIQSSVAQSLKSLSGAVMSTKETHA